MVVAYSTMIMVMFMVIVIMIILTAILRVFGQRDFLKAKFKLKLYADLIALTTINCMPIRKAQLPVNGPGNWSGGQNF